MRLLLLAAALALVAVWCLGDPAVPLLPENPHRALAVPGECTRCHATARGEVDPHGFRIPIADMCLTEACHTAAALGRSHPVGVNARRSDAVDAVPENLPLEQGAVSCGSCHQPHGEWLSPARCYPDQPPKVLLAETANGAPRQTPYYATYYLRVPGDPEEGFTPLCNSCHPR